MIPILLILRYECLIICKENNRFKRLKMSILKIAEEMWSLYMYMYQVVENSGKKKKKN